MSLPERPALQHLASVSKDAIALKGSRARSAHGAFSLISFSLDRLQLLGLRLSATHQPPTQSPFTRARVWKSPVSFTGCTINFLYSLQDKHLLQKRQRQPDRLWYRKHCFVSRCGCPMQIGPKNGRSDSKAANEKCNLPRTRANSEILTVFCSRVSEIQVVSHLARPSLTPTPLLFKSMW